MKSVLISNRPKWCGKICHEIGKDENGKPIYEKRIEVRKTAPKEVPFKCYIYATKVTKWFHSGIIVTSDELLWLSNGKIKMGDGFGLWANGEDYQCVNGKVIGEFICDKVYLIKNQGNSFVVANEEQGVTNEIARQSCLDYDDMVGYLGNKAGYGLHITDLKIYDKPKELSEFYVHKKVKGGCENCAYYRTPTLEFCQDCKSGKSPKKYLTRPPQSWMYVEELENGQKTAD